MRKYFGVLNTMVGEIIASVAMDVELIKDPEIIDPETLTFQGIANGGIHTLLPLDDPRVATLRLVYQSYKDIKEKPAESVFVVMERADKLIRNVGRLFDEVEYIVIRGKSDLNAIINPAKNENHEFEIQKVSVLTDIMRDIVDDVGKTKEILEKEDD